MRGLVRNLVLRLPYTALAATAVESPGLASASGIYNSSETPQNLPWNTYNFCNAPHVNAAHYELPPQATTAGVGDAQLLHVSVVMRHHKVRPGVLSRSRAQLKIGAQTHIKAHAGQPRTAGGHARPARGSNLGLHRRRSAHVRPRRHRDRARRDNARTAAVRAHDVAGDV